MLQPPPARPGMREDEVDTPALLIDLDAFEYNLDHMAELLAPTKAKLRAHAKTHKCAVIAKLQMARGAIGQCVQKVAEAEALAWGGIPDILVSNEVVGTSKLARLWRWSASARLRCAPTMRHRLRRSRPLRRMPAFDCRCWWRSTLAQDAAASSRVPTQLSWPSASVAERPAHRILDRDAAAAVILGGLQQRLEHGAVRGGGAEHQVRHDAVERGAGRLAAGAALEGGIDRELDRLEHRDLHLGEPARAAPGCATAG